LSDIFDGIIARRLGVSTPALRRYDSATDVVFWLAIFYAAWRVVPEIIRPGLPWLIALIVQEAACVGISLLRFRRLPATHSYLAKAYGVSLSLVFLLLLANGGPAWLVPAIGILGTLANVEILTMFFLVKTSPVDVPTIFHLFALNFQTETNGEDSRG
jgi:CDP-diacylglycerol--glycerol-3-phosphate 3-phosphatidyltransferase